MKTRHAILGLLAIVLMIGCGLVGWAFLKRAGPPSPAMTETIDPVLRDAQRLNGEAEAAAIAGRLAEARDKYRRLIALSNEHTDDARFTALADSATQASSRLELILQKHQSPAGQPIAVHIETATKSAPAPTPVVTVASEPIATPPATQSEANIQPVAPQPVGESGINDQQIGAAISKASEFLLSNFDANGKLKDINGIANPVDHDGLEALCVYALLQAGQATNDPRLSLREPLMKKLVDQLKHAPLNSDPNLQMPVTYSRSLRAA